MDDQRQNIDYNRKVSKYHNTNLVPRFTGTNKHKVFLSIVVVLYFIPLSLDKSLLYQHISTWALKQNMPFVTFITNKKSF